jgi:hypothetical protein
MFCALHAGIDFVQNDVSFVLCLSKIKIATGEMTTIQITTKKFN